MFSAIVYRLTQATAAVQLTGDGRCPRLARLPPETVVKIAGEEDAAGFVKVLIGRDLYHMFQEDLSARGERLVEAADAAVD